MPAWQLKLHCKSFLDGAFRLCYNDRTNRRYNINLPKVFGACVQRDNPNQSAEQTPHADPKNDAVIRRILEEAEEEGLCAYHELRHRNTGRTSWVEAHLLFPGAVSVLAAHRAATSVENRIREALGGEVIVTTHLEPRENHEAEHPDSQSG